MKNNNFHLLRNQRNKNNLIIGSTGTGKSIFIVEQIKFILKNFPNEKIYIYTGVLDNVFSDIKDNKNIVIFSLNDKDLDKKIKNLREELFKNKNRKWFFCDGLMDLDYLTYYLDNDLLTNLIDLFYSVYRTGSNYNIVSTFTVSPINTGKGFCQRYRLPDNIIVFNTSDMFNYIFHNWEVDSVIKKNWEDIKEAISSIKPLNEFNVGEYIVYNNMTNTIDAINIKEGIL